VILVEPHVLIKEERIISRNSTEIYRFAIRHLESKKKITMRKLFAGNKDLESWNLCALWNKPPSGQEDRPIVETLQCASIALDFKSKEEAEDFVMKFKTVAGGRLNQIKAVKDIRKYVQSEADSKKPLSAAQALIRRVDASTLNSPEVILQPNRTAVNAPTLGPLPEFSPIDEETGLFPAPLSANSQTVPGSNVRIRNGTGSQVTQVQSGDTEPEEGVEW
jgi:hypothetical protein